MEKVRVTKKEMKDNKYIVSIGYCQASTLLRYVEPIAYSTGIYGWSCDYYNVNGVIISVGYNTLNNKNTKATYEMINKYEKMARRIDDSITDFDIKFKKINKLLVKFVEESKEE